MAGLAKYQGYDWYNVINLLNEMCNKNFILHEKAKFEANMAWQ